jgi:hypothetical protein
MWESLEPDLGLEHADGLARKLKAAIALITLALLLLGAFTLDDNADVQIAVQSSTGGEK